MENVVIVAAKRTPVGSFQGALSALPAPRLGAAAIKGALAQAALQPGDVDELVFGEVLTAGVGQAPARQAALYAGLAPSVPCMTINKVCGSGLKAVMLGADSIRLGNANVVVAGGQENMSLAPHLLENSRTGYRMGPATVVDSMIKDGLWDPYNNWHMGTAAELCVKEYKVTREEQDAFAIDSYKKAQAATAAGHFKNEIAPVEIEGKKGVVKVETDEEPTKAMFDKMPGLRPAFDKDGTITAANASKINDGGAAIIMMSETEAKKRGTKPLAKIVASATFAQDPKWFTTAPVGAIKKALAQANLKVADIGLWEINEAFSVVTQVAMKELEIPADRVNVHGGAVAIGHPIGASGARILTTLVYALQTHNKQYGLATLCIGGGEAVALIIEKA
ncbi:MAG: thiolase family protein [Bdellovibrionaceae bacterium]|nr:thiolase family protein [Pseudobdellovibrionaceae bacterium]